MFNSVQAHFGRVDILVNNAGTIHREAAVKTSLESWQQVLQVNLTSVLQSSHLAARDMMTRDAPGKIINIASLLSFQGGIRVPAYTASKGAVAQLTKALANEWASSNIQVNALAPGYFAAANTEALQADEPATQKPSTACKFDDQQDMTGVFKPDTTITLSVVGTKLTAKGSNTKDGDTLSLEGTITPNTFGGAGAFWSGGVTIGNSNVYREFEISYPGSAKH